MATNRGPPQPSSPQFLAASLIEQLQQQRSLRLQHTQQSRFPSRMLNSATDIIKSLLFEQKIIEINLRALFDARNSDAANAKFTKKKPPTIVPMPTACRKDTPQKTTPQKTQRHAALPRIARPDVRVPNSVHPMYGPISGAAYLYKLRKQQRVLFDSSLLYPKLTIPEVSGWIDENRNTPCNKSPGPLMVIAPEPEAPWMPMRYPRNPNLQWKHQMMRTQFNRRYRPVSISEWPAGFQEFAKEFDKFQLLRSMDRPRLQLCRKACESKKGVCTEGLEWAKMDELVSSVSCVSILSDLVATDDRTGIREYLLMKNRK